ncbi:unnamed protein product [Symbiodinium sp. CCMP2592]|nr:unnamed protein product [Symbiodinium sp. CCMP2592]
MRFAGRGGMGRTFGGVAVNELDELLPPPTPLSHRSTGAAEGPRSFVGACSFQNQGKNGENQDSWIAAESGSKSLLAVLDGHGEQGKRVSEYARSQLARSLYASKDLYTKPASALQSAYAETQKGIERSHAIDAQRSGTTAVTCYRHRDKLVVANVGDSRAVLGRCSSREGDGSLHTLRAVDLSSDQRPMREDERSRILQQGGAVHPSAMPMRQGFGPPVLVRVGPERVWDKTGRCGLCVTRSLGDLSMHPFVIAEPEVSERMLSSKDKVLILGSDGVWDRLNSQEAVDIAARHTDPNAAAREIASIARQRWHAETQGQLSDDITAVVMHLDHGDAGPRAAPTARPSSKPPRLLPETRPRQRPPLGLSETVPKSSLMSGLSMAAPAHDNFAETAPAKARHRRLEPLRSQRAERLGLLHLPAAGMPTRPRRPIGVP